MDYDFAQQPAEKPRVGGWGVAVFLFGFVGGIVGWLSLKNTDRRRADHVLKWGLIWSGISVAAGIVTVLVVTELIVRTAGHLESVTPATPVDTAPAYIPSTTTVVDAPDAVESVAKTIGLTTSDGYSASASIVVYKPAHASALPRLPNSGRTSLESCQADSVTDAVIPVSYTITNDTTNFPTTVGATFTPNDTSGAGAGLEGDDVFTDSSVCDSVENGDSALYSVSFNDPVQPAGEVSGDFYLVVPNFYSPSFPDGDLSQLRQTSLSFSLQLSATGSYDYAPNQTVELAPPAPRPRPLAPAAGHATPAETIRSGIALDNAGYEDMRAGNYAAALPLVASAVRKLHGSGVLDEGYADFNLAYTRFQLGQCTDVLGLLDEAESIEGDKSPIDALRAKASATC